ncbi:MAG TPA: hypothetical protein VN814_23775 [Caulobacteraceae bacterium]|nr:hypothetical protein [Caulobacteraceae bacterium]
MEPGNGGGLGASGGAVVAALIVAVLVLLMVNIGGGLRPVLTQPHVAMTHAPQGQG